jgi:hypothetical protein
LCNVGARQRSIAERLNGDPDRDRAVAPPASEAARGTLGGLIVAYCKSPEFRELAERTRADYRKIFDYLQPLDGHLLVEITPNYVLEVCNAAFDKRRL